MVDAKHGFLYSGDHTVHDREREDLVLALVNDAGGGVDLVGEQPGRDVNSAVAGPVGGVMASLDSLINGEVGGDPVHNEVGALDKAPQVPIDPFLPVGRHGAVAQLLKPQLQVEAVSNDPEVPCAVSEPNERGELSTANCLGTGHPLGREGHPSASPGSAGGHRPSGPGQPGVGWVQAAPVAVRGPTKVLGSGQGDGELRMSLGGREMRLDRENAAEQRGAR
jgi:hypothetical protein